MNDERSYQTTVVFADVAGSSRLYKEVGDAEANRQIAALINEIIEVIETHRGVLIKTIGDEVMCHFTQANKAFEAVTMMQQLGLQTLPLRIGMAWGPVIEKDNDIFGETVNDAAAVAKIARARQIITTAHFYQALDPVAQQQLSHFDEIRLKGDQQKTRLYRVDWEAGNVTQSIAKQTVIMSAISAVQNKLVVSFHCADGRTDSITLTPTQHIPLHVGRDHTQCKLAIDSPAASRDHCHIDYQYGKFMLVDHSTNGTYVRNAAGQQVYLRRQETPLIGKGEISLGVALDDSTGDSARDNERFVIHFSA